MHNLVQVFKLYKPCITHFLSGGTNKMFVLKNKGNNVCKYLAQCLACMWYSIICVTVTPKAQTMVLRDRYLRKSCLPGWPLTSIWELGLWEAPTISSTDKKSSLCPSCLYKKYGLCWTPSFLLESGILLHDRESVYVSSSNKTPGCRVSKCTFLVDNIS